MIHPTFFSPSDYRFMMEMDQQPSRDSILFAHGIGLLNGGRTDGWSVERFERLMQYSAPFDGVPSATHPTHIVVASAGTIDQHTSPELDLPLSTAELHSDVFTAVVSQLADKHRLKVIVLIHTTNLTIHPEDGEDDYGWEEKREFGEDDEFGRIVIEFFTAELFKLGGVKAYWGGVLDAMKLRWGVFYSPFQRYDITQPHPYETREIDAFLAQLSQIPESVLGNPDNVTCDPLLDDNVKVTLIRHHFEEPAATAEGDDPPATTEHITVRAFLVESIYEQGRRHRGGR
jgi:hypothetical protein